MHASSQALETPRLQLRKVALSDAAFFLGLLNEPSWRENIGDRGIRSIDDAERYIQNNIWGHYQAHGFGMYTVELKSTGLPIGICGLVKRDYLSSPDLGFALLPDYVGCGYAGEAAGRVLSHARDDLGIARLCAIAKRGNDRSARLLDRLGFRFQGPHLTPQGEEVELYATT
jgi:[ribosomal protein S5]-alanine N-acetyltransferase